MTRKSGWQELENTDNHVVSTVKKQQLTKPCIGFLLFIHSKVPAHGMIPHPFKLDLSSVCLIQIILYQYTQRFVSSVILDPVKLMISITIKPYLTVITYNIHCTWNNLTQGNQEKKASDIRRVATWNTSFASESEEMDWICMSRWKRRGVSSSKRKISDNHRAWQSKGITS